MRIPDFKTYYPSVEEMSRRQRKFYEYLSDELNHGRYPAVHGNISYLFVYAYDIIRRAVRTEGDKRLPSERSGDLSLYGKPITVDYAEIWSRLLDLAEAYHNEPKFRDYCRTWAYDCLLGQEQYETFLLLTEPEDLFATTTHFSNLRCSVCHHIGRPAAAVDLFKLSGFQVTEYTKKHATPFRDLLEAVFKEDAQENAPWLDRLVGGHVPWPGRHTLFNGVPFFEHPVAKFRLYCFYENVEILRAPIREAENRLREIHGIPKVDEGWVRETALYNALKAAFPETQVVQHGKPAWLGRQHLDIWLPRWRIAVEYQGTQHFEPVEIFGGRAALEETRRRDRRKRNLCRRHGVSFVLATEEDDHASVIERVRQVKEKSGFR